tara:strand:+ start:1797 stop:5474 length:3678 start_codon:yes stop_codon:yes gene_type:complete
MSAQNSISQLLEQFLELNTNSLETFNRINEAISTDKETVTVDLWDPSGEGVKSVQIPAFGYLKREIERLNKNLESISGVEGNGASVRLKDGTYRKVYTSRLKGPSKPITSLASPTKFNTKLNEFFEDFLNPLLTVRLDVSGQIPVETERVYIERFIFDSNDGATSDSFNELYKGESEIVYKELQDKIAEDNLKYYLDSEVIEMPIRTIQYFGDFDVTRISNEQRSKIVDGTTQTKTIKLFTLDKLSYSDSSKTLLETEVLKVSDSLVINSGELKTRYIVRSIDSSTSQVELELIEGFESIKVGSNVLSIYRDIDLDLDVEIKIGFNEKQIVFIKPIDPRSNIPSNEYSPGIGFYSNELQIEAEDGTIKNLSSYYRDEVSDFGQFIKGLSVDYIPPAAIGVTPDSPAISSENLKVIQINKHLTDNTTTKKIKQLKSDKLSADQSLKNINEAIKVKKSLLNTKKFESKVERDKQFNEFKALVDEKSSEVKLFGSIVAEIKASADSSDISSASPKFRVRGFWPIPAPKTFGEELSQEVVQFKTRYRYVSTSGKTSSIDQIAFNDTTNNTKKTAAFSNWVEVDGPVRKRELNEDGKYKWIIESEEDSQAVNFNSIDLPIRSGEIVEIMVKSVSEAGFPANPLTSEWSDVIKVEFPEGELSTDSLAGLVSQNELDNLKVSLKEDLESIGVYDHVGDSFTINEKYYAHNAAALASGFLTGEQNPISVYDKLLQLQIEVETLRAQIDGTLGELLVQLVDEDGNVTPVSNNSTVKLFAGYYIDEIPSTNSKGSIVTKNFKINLSNTKASNLELIARILGDTDQPAYSSTASSKWGLQSGTIDPTVASNAYYTTEGRYDLVPVVYQNLEDTESGEVYFNDSPIQSSQLRGQFIYSRFMNLANSNGLYLQEAEGTDGDIDVDDVSGYDVYEYGINTAYLITASAASGGGDIPLLGTAGSKDFTGALQGTHPGSSTTGDFIWNGKKGTAHGILGVSQVTPALYDNAIFIHENHPKAIAAISAAGLDALQIASNGLIGFPKTTPRKAGDSFGKQQTPFKLTPTRAAAGTGGYGTRTASKSSFEPDDQYLLGGKSCGSFLYISPLSKDSLVVDASNKRGKKIIEGSSANSITVDLVFQYRMTDYYGAGSGAGSGKIGGIVSNTFQNLTYSKKIGVDIIDSNSNDFQFDVEVYAKYRATGKNINSITSSMLTNYRNNGKYTPFGGRDVDFSIPSIRERY